MGIGRHRNITRQHWIIPDTMDTYAGLCGDRCADDQCADCAATTAHTHRCPPDTGGDCFAVRYLRLLHQAKWSSRPFDIALPYLLCLQFGTTTGLISLYNDSTCDLSRVHIARFQAPGCIGISLHPSGGYRADLLTQYLYFPSFEPHHHDPVFTIR